MKVSIIAAMDRKRGIGKDNKIPWHIKEDLVHLKNLTRGHAVILGRKTYDSMVFYYNKSGNPMPGKLYIVVTHDKNYKPVRENAMIAHSLEEAKKLARKKHLRGARSGHLGGGQRTPPRWSSGEEQEIFIIGGRQIFQQALPLADKLYLTIVEGDYACDTFFPRFSEFKTVVSEEKRESDGYKYKFLELERNK